MIGHLTLTIIDGHLHWTDDIKGGSHLSSETQNEYQERMTLTLVSALNKKWKQE